MAQGRWEPLGTLMALIANVMGGRRRAEEFDPFVLQREDSHRPAPQPTSDPFAIFGD